MNKPDIQDALKALRNQEVILMPHDSGWCLAADATQEMAVQKLKGFMPETSEITVLVSDLNMLGRYIKDFPPFAADILEFAENPVIARIPDAMNLADSLYSENKTAAFRMIIPRNEPGKFISKLIFQLRKPLASIEIPFLNASRQFANLKPLAPGFKGFIIPYFHTFEFPDGTIKHIQFRTDGTFTIDLY